MSSGMVVNTNISALNAQRQMLKTNNSLSTSMQRLASGLRVNSAKDDAAGLAIADKMTSQIRGMGVAVRNANDGISLSQTAEAAMGELTGIMQRMRDLAVQSANDGAITSVDRTAMQDEFGELQSELTRIITSTEFNGKKIINGSLASGGAFQVGANNAADNKITVSIANLSIAISNALAGNITVSGVSAGNALSAIDVLDASIATIDSARSKLGAVQSRFTSTISNLQSSIENNSAARSRIQDADFASETAALSRNQILQQAGTAMLSQANQAPNAVMGLLR